MSSDSQAILSKALLLSPIDRAELIELLLSSFESPSNSHIDEFWTKEVEERIDAYEQNQIQKKSVKDVFNRIQGK